MFKKLITLSLAFIAILTLTACGNKDEDNENLALLEDAKSVLIIHQGLVEGDLTLPATGANDVTITWASDKPAVIAVDGSVTRPAAGTGNETVVLTATLTLGDDSVTKEITLLVAQMPNVNAFTSVATLHTDSSVGDDVSFQGIVSGVYADGYMVSDGTNAVNIYDPGMSFVPVVGDTVLVSGEYAKYKTAYQISSVVSQEVVTAGTGVNPMTATVSTVAAVQNLDSSDPLIHSQIYTITGDVVIKDDFDGYSAVFIVDGDAEVKLYYRSLEDSLTALEDKAGKEVTLDVIYYTEDEGDAEVYVVFDGGADDLVETILTGRAAFDSDIAAAGNDIPALVVDHYIILPTVGDYGTTFTDWVSSDPTIFDAEGSFYSRGDVTTTVTFTGTATLGTMSEEVTISVIVPINMDVAVAKDTSYNTPIEVTGVVYGFMYYGFFLADETGIIFVKTSDYNDELEVGDKITVLGYKGDYKGTDQVDKVLGYKLVSEDNAVPAVVAGTVAGAVNDLYERGTTITITGTVTATVSGSNTNYSLVGPAGEEYGIYYRSTGIDFISAQVGNMVTVDVITYQDELGLYMGDAAGVVVVTTVSEAYTAQSAIDSIVIEDMDMLTSNVTLPGTVADVTGSVITWVSDTHATILDDGTIVVPFGSDAYATLTATLVLGDTTLTRTFDVTVKDGDLGDPVDVTTALAETDDTILLVTGVVVGFNAAGKAYIQDADGTAIFVDAVLDVEIGDLIVVRGMLDTNTSWGDNDQRYLKSVEYIETTSTDNAVFVIVESVTITPELISAFDTIGDFQNQTFTLDLTVVRTDDGYGAAEFAGSDRLFVLNLERFAPYFGDVYAIGDVITITFTMGVVDYEDIVMDNVTLPVLTTDADSLAAAQGWISLIPTSVATDLVLPTMFDDNAATIVWTSSNTDVITDGGVVTRPAFLDGPVVVTMTAVITTGTVDTTVTIDVTVLAEDPIFRPVGTEIFISEYIEGGSYNKAIELFNPTAAEVDLTGYLLRYYSAGGTTYTELALDGYVIASGGTLVLANSGANATMLAVTDVVNNFINHNGDDCYELVNGTVVIDSLGTWGDVDWGKDKTLVRDMDVLVANTTYTVAEWNSFAKDTDSYLGAHVMNPDAE